MSILALNGLVRAGADVSGQSESIDPCPVCFERTLGVETMWKTHEDTMETLGFTLVYRYFDLCATLDILY